MRKTLVVAARELRERWLLLPGGLVIGCLPLVLPAFGAQRVVAVGIGLMLAFLLAGAAAVVIGSSMLARDAANGRLALLFSQPLGWPAIWGGKWLAALALVAVTGLLASLGSILAYPPQTVRSWPAAMDAAGAVLLLLEALLAIGLANSAATLFFARSAWVAVDLLLLLASLWPVAHYVAPLWAVAIAARIHDAQGWLWSLTLLPLVIGLLVGSALQVAVGRTDVRRAHRWLSVGFWAVMLATLLGATGWVAWIEAAGPADLRWIQFERPSPDGRWVYVQGHANRGGQYSPGFLLDTSSGRYVATTRLSVRHLVWFAFDAGATFSADGGLAVRCAEAHGGTALDVVDLQAEPPRITRVRLESSVAGSWWTSAALSPSSKEALVVQDSSLTLFALPAGTAIASSPFPPNWHLAAARFRGEDVRAWIVPFSPGSTRPPGPGEVRVLDLVRGRQPKTTAFSTSTRLTPFSSELVADQNGDRLLTLDSGLQLRDGANGAVLASLVEGRPVKGARFLSDGRIAAFEADRQRMVVRVFEPDGREQRAIEIARPTPMTDSYLGPELRPGRVVVATANPLLHRISLVVDLAQGRVVERLDGLRPAPAKGWPGGLTPPQAVARFTDFVDDGGQLVRIDGQTGKRRVLAGPGAAQGKRLGRL